MFLRFSRSISCAVDNVILYLQLNVKDFGEFQVFAFFLKYGKCFRLCPK